MKRILQLFQILILCCTASVGHCGTLNDNIGLTNFLFDSNNFDKVSQFKVQSYFVDNFRVTKGNTEFFGQPSWQNFKYDDVLANAKKNGVFNIWRFQGAFDFQQVQGKQNKVNPIRDADDPLLQSSWTDLGSLAVQIAIRYADDTGPYLSRARVHRSADWLNNTPKAGLGLVGAMEYTNEPDFLHSWNQGTRTLTPEQWATGFKVFRDSIRSVSQTMKIICGGTIQPKIETFERVIAQLQKLYAAEGKPMPTDWYLNFHWYMRNGSINQGAGTWGISPETAKAYKFGLQLDSLCRVYGFPGWYCTETGWSTYTTGTNIDLGKQNAPKLEGYDIYQSQGLCMVRLAWIWGATEYCKGITFWNRKDNDDVGAYQNGGVNFSNWTPKPCIAIIAEYQALYRHHNITNYRTNGTYHAVDLTSADSTITLVWTDINKAGEFDAKPRPGVMPPVTPPLPPVDPPQTTPAIKIQYSTNASHTGAVELKDGVTLPPGLYYIFAEPSTLKTPVTFWMFKDGVPVQLGKTTVEQKEGGYPFDFKGGPWHDFTNGTYSLKVTSGTQSITIAFSVGTVAPPVTKEPVLEQWIEGGKLYIRTGVKTYSIAIP